MSFWMGSTLVHELYTAASGLYLCWLSIRGATMLLSWMPQGRSAIMIKVHEWTLMVGLTPLDSPLMLWWKQQCCGGCQQLLKTLVVAVMLAGLVPLLLGLLFELVIVAPLRVPLDQTPLFYPWQVGLRVGRENIPTG